MSGFGRPPGVITFSPTPPQRGSFPLDHDNECQPVMKDYLACLKKVRGSNDPECRLLAKDYLKCRMDRQLMAKDEWENLGFGNEPGAKKRGKELEEEEVNAGVGAAVIMGGESVLDRLRRENKELVEKRKREEAAAGKK